MADKATAVGPWEIGLLGFLRSGKFGPVVTGISRERLHFEFGEPDGYGPQDDRTRASIWKYGIVEFHFNPETDTVFLIFTDDLSELRASYSCAAYTLDAGMFRDGPPSWSMVTTELLRSQIAFTSTRDSIGGPVIRTDAGVEILFEEMETFTPETLHVSAISRQSWDPAAR